VARNGRFPQKQKATSIECSSPYKMLFICWILRKKIFVFVMVPNPEPCYRIVFKDASSRAADNACQLSLFFNGHF
jgi:hypothetical protein